MCGLCVWLAVWEEGMGGMCGISSTQTQEDRMVNRKRTHNQGIRIEDVAFNSHVFCPSAEFIPTLVFQFQCPAHN